MIQKIEPAAAIRLLDAKKAQAVDVREPDEYAVGHIPGAKLLPLGGIIFCFFSHDLYSFFQPLSFWIFAVFFAIFTISIIIVIVYNHVKGNPVIKNISE